MGWTFIPSMLRKSELVAMRLREARAWPGHEIGAHGTSTSGLWYVVKPIDGRKPFLAFDLMQRSGGSWGYKEMSVDMGPCEVDCPIAVLAAAVASGVDFSEGYAAEWLARRNVAHARKVTAKDLQIGRTVYVYGKPYSIMTVSPLRGRDAEGNFWKLPRKAVRLSAT